ncbi:MAG: protealysin inhibitor emfourin [Gammaproteobacteria bacterium]
MHVVFTSEGGIAHFPGLSAPVTIESDKLSNADAAELERLVGAARFFDLPSALGVPPRGAADYHRYTVTIDSGTCRHTVQLAEPIADAAIHRLVAFLRAQAKAFRKR